jgi:Mn2+/Fe2+ NRAMP family transporter
MGLLRKRFGVRWGAMALICLVLANLGTTCAEFAGVAAGFELAGVSRYASVPVAALIVSWLVLKGSFHRVEHILLVLATAFGTYIAAGILAGPDGPAAARGLVIPSMPLTSDSVLVVTATVGTTLAPWGLAFIQSYSVDKRLGLRDLNFLRVDVVVGALMTGLIGFFVVVACAATLHAAGHQISDAGDAAVALQPLAGDLASLLFGAGLVGAALLAASILPLSTAYSVSEALGYEAALDDSPREAPVFYSTYAVVTAVAVGLVLMPGVNLVAVLLLTQVLNAILLVPLLVFMRAIGADRDVMGEATSPRWLDRSYIFAIVVIAASVLALLTFSL